eukprot:TRINITY_DN8865_c0_g2_i1.p2 TRINITY_DN8865_c0_g2~~TRINITY_DN8865_c0_g2_i1.p2  ORF type:complete len:104 (-),score=17.29 TRINITY_DN8865_c0_g2_i1:213-524(-)
MSRKNCQKRKREQHQADLERDKLIQKQRQKAQDKTLKRLAITKQLTKKKKKTKGVRVKRGMRIRGIRVVDKESKNAVLQKLKEEQAMKMLVDEEEEWEEVMEQ